VRAAHKVDQSSSSLRSWNSMRRPCIWQNMGLLLILGIGLFAGVVSGVIGTGSSIMLLPVLAHVYGPKTAVPVMAVAAVMANISRILVWWRQVDWRACAAYAATGVPAAVLGARTMLVLPPRAVDAAMGCFCCRCSRRGTGWLRTWSGCGFPTSPPLELSLAS
jgi:hypothetical protein